MLQPSNPEMPRRRRRRLLPFSVRARVFLVLALVVLAGLGAWVWLQPQRAVSTFTVTYGDISARVSANARVRAIRSARLSFAYSGKLAQVNVQEGDTVKAGEVLAELQSDDFDRRISQAELTLAARRLDLERAQAPPRAEDLQIAQASLKKTALALALAEANASARNAGPNADAARQSAQADYDIASANLNRLTRGPTPEELRQLQNSLQAAQLDLEASRQARAQTQLLAPYDGIVTEVNAQPGEMVGGYNPVVAIADLTRLELFADIDEIDVGAVAPGQPVEVRLDAFPGELLSGTVTQLFPAASDQRGTLVYHARIQFDRGKLAVRPGMGATLKIATVERKNVLLVPSRAVRNAGTQKIVSELIEGVQRDVVVETGLSDGNQTEIVSGLTPGAEVVVD